MAAWRAAGIQPWNPQRVLNPESHDITHTKTNKIHRLSFSIPATPYTSRGARGNTKEALALVTGNSVTSRKLRALISQLDKGL